MKQKRSQRGRRQRRAVRTGAARKKERPGPDRDDVRKWRWKDVAERRKGGETAELEKGVPVETRIVRKLRLERALPPREIRRGVVRAPGDPTRRTGAPVGALGDGAGNQRSPGAARQLEHRRVDESPIARLRSKRTWKNMEWWSALSATVRTQRGDWNVTNAVWRGQTQKRSSENTGTGINPEMPNAEVEVKRRRPGRTILKCLINIFLLWKKRFLIS